MELTTAIQGVQRVVRDRVAEILSRDEHDCVGELIPRCHGGDPVAGREMITHVAAILERGAIRVTGMDREAAAAAIYAHLWGLGPVEDLWARPDVDELQVTPHYVVRVVRGRVERLDVAPPEADEVRRIIDRTLFHVGGIHEGNPHVEAVRLDGTRITATVPPRSTFPILILRRHGAWAVDPSHLMAAGMFDEQGFYLMQMLVRSRHNILIVGPCGSGKTTLLRLLAGFFHRLLQVVSVELGHPELLLSRFYSGRIYRELVASEPGELAATYEAALRESPDVLLASEVRGAMEAAAAERAAGRGHAGTMATFHALTPAETVESMAVLWLEAGRNLPLPLLQEWVARRFQIVINLWADSIRGYKRVLGITELAVEAKEVIYRPLCRWVSDGDDFSVGRWQYFAPSASVLERCRRQGDPGALTWWREVADQWSWDEPPDGALP